MSNRGRPSKLEGKRFGYLVAIERVENHVTKGGNSIVRWKCKCDCGNEKIVTAGHLRTGHTTSCGKCGLAGPSHEFDDLTGRKFGYLTVISRADDYVMQNSRYTMSRWNCECECGEHIIVTSGHLKTNHTRSCGKCGKYDRSVDFTGQRFGKLCVLKRSDEWYTYPNGDRDFKWICKCDCGNTIVVRGNSLRNKNSIQSCGCNYKSKWEIWLSQFLESHCFKYVSPKCYKDLHGVGGLYLSYDFCVTIGSKDVLIECQGLQHYKPIEYFGGQDQFDLQLEHDARKRNYAKLRNIPLIELDCSKNMSKDAYFSILTDVFSEYV